MELKEIKVDVISKNNKNLSPTNMLIAQTLIARDKAVWVNEGKVIMLLKTKQDFKELKNKIITEERRVCYICKRTIPEYEKATIDHVNPRSRYGKDERENLHCCCKRCNDDKGSRTYDEYVSHIKRNPFNYTYLNFNKL